MKKIGIILFVLCISLSACLPGNMLAQTVTPSPTVTSSPTNTPLPSVTPTLTEPQKIAQKLIKASFIRIPESDEKNCESKCETYILRDLGMQGWIYPEGKFVFIIVLDNTDTSDKSSNKSKVMDYIFAGYPETVNNSILASLLSIPKQETNQPIRETNDLVDGYAIHITGADGEALLGSSYKGQALYTIVITPPGVKGTLAPTRYPLENQPEGSPTFTPTVSQADAAPTVSASPKYTITPRPLETSPISKWLEGAEISQTIPLVKSDTYKWPLLNQDSFLPDGIFLDRNSTGWLDYDIKAGQAVSIIFTLPETGQIQIGMQSRGYNQIFYIDIFYVDVFDKEYFEYTYSDLEHKTTKTSDTSQPFILNNASVYGLLQAMTKNGDFVIYIWEVDHPENVYKAAYKISYRWKDNIYQFFTGNGSAGRMMIKEINILNFKNLVP